jgi:voltage-gated potassium channel Kch
VGASSWRWPATTGSPGHGPIGHVDLHRIASLAEGLRSDDERFLTLLGATGTGKTVTVPITDGVFPESKEFLAGFWLVDVLPVILGRFGSITLLPYAIVLAFIAVFGGGVAFAHIEGISLFDGMYWANTTVNTVGYGDVSAQTNEGKLLSMVLQWTGNVILALLIGGIAAAAQRVLLGTQNLKRELDEIEEEVDEVSENVEEVEEDVERLLKDARNLSETDRVILRELQNIKRRLDQRPEG